MEAFYELQFVSDPAGYRPATCWIIGYCDNIKIRYIKECENLVTSNCNNINVYFCLGGDRGFSNVALFIQIEYYFYGFYADICYLRVRYNAISLYPNLFEISNAAFFFMFLFLYALPPIISERHLLEHIYLCLFGFRPF